MSRWLLLGAFAILAGAALLSWSGGFGLSRGALLIVGAALAVTLLGEPLVHRHPHYPDLHHRHEH
jgi:drug/metabolite transporter (DMT)-like permease